MALEINPFDHILYEFSMYIQASIARCEDQFIINLLVDSRMVHMRNLAYFFCSSQDKGKKYLHYQMFIKPTIPQEIDHTLFDEIQRISSNATCHLLKGRMKEAFKQETAQFQQMIFPRFVSLIYSFILLLNQDGGGEYASDWEDERIQENATMILSLIEKIRENEQSTVVTPITTE